MKKINKKGFTLIELLVVLVILSVIMMIAIPSVTSSIERSKDKQKKAKIDLVISAAELYFDSHRNNSDGTCVEVDYLINNGYLTKEEAKDPFDENNNVCGSVKKNDTTYTCKNSKNCS